MILVFLRLWLVRAVRLCGWCPQLWQSRTNRNTPAGQRRKIGPRTSEEKVPGKATNILKIILVWGKYMYFLDFSRVLGVQSLHQNGFMVQASFAITYYISNKKYDFYKLSFGFYYGAFIPFCDLKSLYGSFWAEGTQPGLKSCTRTPYLWRNWGSMYYLDTPKWWIEDSD